MPKEVKPQLNELEVGLRAAAQSVDMDENASFTLPSLDNKAGDQTPATQENAEQKTAEELAADAEKLSQDQKIADDKSGTKQTEPKNKDDATKSDDTTKPDPNESKYKKAQKEADRKEKSWATLNAEKEALKVEKEAIAKARAEVEAARKEANKPRDRAVELEEEAKKYDKSAKDFDDEGREDLVKACKEKAAGIRELIGQNQQEVMKAKHDDFVSKWDGYLANAEKEIPELANAQSVVHQEVAGILKQWPVLTSYPEGIRDAIEVVKLRNQARLVPDLQKQLTEAKAKITELQSATALPNAVNSQRGGGPKSMSQMSDEEQISAIREMAADVDAGSSY